MKWKEALGPAVAGGIVGAFVGAVTNGDASGGAAAAWIAGWSVAGALGGLAVWYAVERLRPKPQPRPSPSTKEASMPSTPLGPAATEDITATEQPANKGQAPVKVCPNCSVQERATGDFCPHCGSSYLRKGRTASPLKPFKAVGRSIGGLSKRTKIVVAVVCGVLLLGGIGGGVALKVKSDNDAQEKREAAEQAAEAKKKQELAAQDAQAALDDTERSSRRSLVRGLQRSITKDAKKNVDDGLLDGPILRTACEPVGGGSEDILADTTGKYECLAVSKTNDDGTSSGYSYNGTVNYDDFSYTWRLGN